ncbi:hypothetical protein QR680_002240 [Steinernema hermaphroditum]|uniref:Endoplasmic reticulum junction formation protein lunapark n=1 Tax=Steinernema hermaphroditum TaxID=289476 RepID=A0AA39LHS7_9BILA|nr:hypothetical protein QR680_002240 [Steinernema hermaphroditum]
MCGKRKHTMLQRSFLRTKLVKGKTDLFDETSLNFSLLNKTKIPDSDDVHDVTMIGGGDAPSASYPTTPYALSPNPSRRPKTTRPFYPESKSSVDRLLDYMCGDGVNKRYALICQRCFTHNGMAHADEADNVAYHCYKCGLFNPARSAVKPNSSLSKNDRSYSEMNLNQPSDTKLLSSLGTTHSMSDDINLVGKERLRTNDTDETISETGASDSDSSVEKTLNA